MPQYTALVFVPLAPGKLSGIDFCISSSITYRAKTAGRNINGGDPNHVAVGYPVAGGPISVIGVYPSKTKQVNDLIDVH